MKNMQGYAKRNKDKKTVPNILRLSDEEFNKSIEGMTQDEREFAVEYRNYKKQNTPGTIPDLIPRV